MGTAPPPIDRFTDRELAAILAAAADLHHYPIVLLMARTGLRLGEACGLRWRDVDLTTRPPRLSVVWQLDRWGDLVHPKSRASRRTIPLRPEVADELDRWRQRQQQRALAPNSDVGGERGLVFTTRNGRPIWTCNVSRSFTRARTAAGVDHGSVKTLRSTVATQLAEAGLHPRMIQVFMGHARMSTTMRYYTASPTSTRSPHTCPTSPGSRRDQPAG